MANIKHYNKSQNKVSRDEFYTPRVLVEAILPYLPKDKIIWSPFDTKNSEFVLVLKENGYKVVYSHIVDGQDFFNYEPEKWDIIVSNPPFTKKLEVLKRLKELNKPFAIILGINCLDYIVMQDYFRNEMSDIQFLFQNRKMSFNGNPSSFNSSYFCRKLLPKQIVFTSCPNNNANQYYKPSMMEIDRKMIEIDIKRTKKELMEEVNECGYRQEITDDDLPW